MENHEIIEEQNNYEKREKRSFLKGAVLGFCFAAIMALLGISIYTLASEQAELRLRANEEFSNAKEVAASAKVQDKLQKIAELIDEQYIEEIDTEKLESYIYKGLLAGTGDAYSEYYSETELKQFMEDVSGSYCGIGVTLQYDSTVNMVKIISINEEGAAAEVDIQENDYIYKVDGEVISLENADTTELVSKVRGEEGTKVKLTLLRGADNKEVEVEVERRMVTVDSVTGQMLEDNIGYIKISQFEGLTAQQFEDKLNELKDAGAQGLVLDLRANPGGQVDSVCEIAEHFLTEGLVTYMEDKYGNRQEYTCDGKNTWDKPLTVLMDGNSASASEILAGAIRDDKVGTLMGTKTFGKGIVQQTINLGDGTAIKLTFAKYYTPNGENIHGKGIEPDIEVEYEELPEGQEYSVETDNQILAAVENVKEQMKSQ